MTCSKKKNLGDNLRNEGIFAGCMAHKLALITWNFIFFPSSFYWPLGEHCVAYFKAVWAALLHFCVAFPQPTVS